MTAECILPADTKGSGRVIRAVRIPPHLALRLLKSIHDFRMANKLPPNPIFHSDMNELGHIVIGTQTFYRSVTVFRIFTQAFGHVRLVVKTIHRTARLNEPYMLVNTFLQSWPCCEEKEFMQKNHVRENHSMLTQRHLTSYETNERVVPLHLNPQAV